MTLQNHWSATLSFIQRQSLHPVAPPLGQKAPSGSNWNSTPGHIVLAKLVAEPFSHNIGAFCGLSLSDWDIDNDDPLFNAALHHFDHTCNHVFGSTARPRTHRIHAFTGGYSRPLLRLVEIISKYNLDGTPGAFRMELLGQSTGTVNAEKTKSKPAPFENGNKSGSVNFTLLPGSSVPNADRYWDDLDRARLDPAPISDNETRIILGFSAMAAVLAYYWGVTDGVHHELRHAMAGGIKRCMDENPDFPLNETRVEEFFDGAMMLCGGDNSKIRAIIRDVWKKADKDVAVTGFTRASEIIFGTDDEKKPERDSFIRLARACFGDISDERKTRERLPFYAMLNDKVVTLSHLYAGMQPASCAVSIESHRNANLHDMVEGVDGKPMHFTTYVVCSPYVARATSMYIDPSMPPPTSPPAMAIPIPQEYDGAPTHFINTWRGFDCKPAEFAAEHGELDTFRHLIQSLFPDEADRNMVLKYYSQLFNEPHVRPTTALVLSGEPGSGKSFLSSYFMYDLVGRTHAQFAGTIKELARQYNGYLGNKLLVTVDEIKDASKVDTEHLKTLITQNKFSGEMKNINIDQDTDFYARIVMCTNAGNPMEKLADVSDNGFVKERRLHLIPTGSKLVGNVSFFERAVREHGETRIPIPQRTDKQKRLMSLIMRGVMKTEYTMKEINIPLDNAAKRLSLTMRDGFVQHLLAMVHRGTVLSDRVHEYYHEQLPSDIVEAGPLRPEDSELWRSGWPGYVEMNALIRDYEEMIRTDKATNGNAHAYKGMNNQQYLARLKAVGLAPQDSKLSQRSVRVNYSKIRDDKRITDEIKTLFKWPTWDAVRDFLANMGCSVPDSYDPPGGWVKKGNVRNIRGDY